MDNYGEDTEDEVIEVEESQDNDEVVEVETEQEEEVEQIDWEARAKKAEQAIIKAKAKHSDTPKNQSGLSTFDMLALQKANIETEEDLDEVTDYANYKKISVAEALKSTFLKATLAEKAEQRTSAMAVNTGTGRRAASGVISDERLLADSSKGILPDSEEDIARLTRLKFAKR